MKLYKASGQCNKCGQYDEALGSTPEDATLLLKHNHEGHPFQGEIKTELVYISEKEAKAGKK